MSMIRQGPDTPTPTPPRSPELQQSLNEFVHGVKFWLVYLCTSLQRVATLQRNSITATELDQILQCMNLLGRAAAAFHLHTEAAEGDEAMTLGPMDMFHIVDFFKSRVDSWRAQEVGTSLDRQVMAVLGGNMLDALETMDEALAVRMVYEQCPIDQRGHHLLVAFLRNAEQFVSHVCGLDRGTHTFQIQQIANQITWAS